MNQTNTFTFTTSGFPNGTVTQIGGPPLPATIKLALVNGKYTLSGTPTATGTYNIIITASDGIGPDFVQAFTLFVTP